MHSDEMVQSKEGKEVFRLAANLYIIENLKCDEVSGSRLTV